MSDDDLRVLHLLLAEYDAVMAAVSDRVAHATGVVPTSRLKTIPTMRDKLRRRTSLSSMQDLAGLRIVDDCTREQQDRLVDRIVAEFPGAEVIDRRERPMFGYRAVHVIVHEAGRPVEIQVRTHLQDIWAQVVEGLGDLWGRQIRYGDPPTDPDATVGDTATRAQVVATILHASTTIDSYERFKVVADLAEALVMDVDLDDLDPEVRRIVDSYNDRSAEMEQERARVQEMLEGLAEVLR